MYVDEKENIFVVSTAHEVFWARFRIFHEVVWHQNLALRAASSPVQDLLWCLIIDSVLLIDAVSLTIIVNTRNCTVEEILSYFLTLDLPWHRGGQQPGGARLTVILIKWVTRSTMSGNIAPLEGIVFCPVHLETEMCRIFLI